MFTHLNVRSWYSFKAGASNPETLARTAAAMGQTALALTDRHTVSGVAAHTRACEKHGLKPIYGAEIEVDGFPLVFLCRDNEGYATLCDLLSIAHLDRDAPHLAFADLQGHVEGLFCLSADRRGRIPVAVQNGEFASAALALQQLQALFKESLFIELTHHRRWGDGALVRNLMQLAQGAGVRTLASNAVRYAQPRHMPLYDALVCARHGLTVADGHPERAINKQAFLCPAVRLRKLGLPQVAIANSMAIADECSVELRPQGITPPTAYVPPGLEAREYLTQLCEQGLPLKYATATPAVRAQAEANVQKELGIICHLRFEEFFLAVREVMEFARSRNILCSGRGSAANSIVAYLLDITYVDPIKNHLLFERFLHEGRRGMPDIDVDFQSDRRDEVIAWMNERWSDRHTAMTANLVTYRLRSAVADMMKVLGFPEAHLRRVTRELPSFSSACQVREHREVMQGIIGDSTALEVLLSLVEQLHDCPQYLGLHSGGMVISHQPLRHMTAIQTSAKGVRQVQFNKDDVEWLGHSKIDVLSLRMLGALAMARDLLKLHKNIDLNLDALPFDDPATYAMLREGRTLGLFQIESPGQIRLLSMTQPERFEDLVPQVALFRPGPLQGNMVNPYVERRRGLAPVTYPHPSLIPVLRDTYGIILYQEQVLEVAHQFAGMSLSQADDFRKLMSKFRSATEMESMRTVFVHGAVQKHGVNPHLANGVFDIVSKFVGYGFCRSHAAAFARIVEQSAYLKAHYPDAYLCGVMEHEPGFYPRQTFVEEARSYGITVLPPCLKRSGAQYQLEGDNRIRVSLARVRGIGETVGAEIALERSLAPWASLEDAVSRLRLSLEQWENLARAGALAAFGVRREELWKVRQYVKVIGRQGQIKLDFELPVAMPALPALSEEEAMVWDYETTGFTSGPHPASFYRTALSSYGAVPIGDLHRLTPKSNVLIGGTVSVRMRPPTAKGMCFITLQDETGYVQTAITPQVFDLHDRVLRAGALLMKGVLQDGGRSAKANFRSLLVEKLWPLDSVVGGAAGHCGENPRAGVASETKRAAA